MWGFEREERTSIGKRKKTRRTRLHCYSCGFLRPVSNSHDKIGPCWGHLALTLGHSWSQWIYGAFLLRLSVGCNKTPPVAVSIKNITQQTWSGLSPTTVLDNNRPSGLSPMTVPEMSTGYYHKGSILIGSTVTDTLIAVYCNTPVFRIKWSTLKMCSWTQPNACTHLFGGWMTIIVLLNVR